MRIRLAVQLDITRSAKPEPEQHEHRDTDSVVENTARRYVGFAPDERPDDE